MEWNTSDKPRVGLGFFFSFWLATPLIDYSYSSSAERRQMVLI